MSKFGKKGQTVLDPFCGSGTTLVEARLLGFNAIGIDVNGLSSLLSKVKATPLSVSEITDVRCFVGKIEEVSFQWCFNRPLVEIKQIEGLEHWFQKNVAEELTCLLDLINQLQNGNVRDFLRIVVSSIIVRVSN